VQLLVRDGAQQRFERLAAVRGGHTAGADLLDYSDEERIGIA